MRSSIRSWGKLAVWDSDSLFGQVLVWERRYQWCSGLVYSCEDSYKVNHLCRVESTVSPAVLLGGEKVERAGSETLFKSLTSAWHVASAQQCLYFLFHKALSVRSFRKESPLNKSWGFVSILVLVPRTDPFCCCPSISRYHLPPPCVSLPLSVPLSRWKGQTDGVLYWKVVFTNSVLFELGLCLKVADHILWTLFFLLSTWHNGQTCRKTSSQTGRYYSCTVVRHQTRSMMDCGR